MEYGKITIGGKAYRLMPEEDYQSSIDKPERARTGYERVEKGKPYYARCHCGCFLNDTRDKYDDSCFEKGDYVNDKKLYNDNARADNILRRMRQWQALNDEAVDIYKGNQPNYFIYYDAPDKRLCVYSTSYYIHNHEVYFTTQEKAEEALEVFKDDLIWLHTQYRRRLDEPKRN